MIATKAGSSPVVRALPRRPGMLDVAIALAVAALVLLAGASGIGPAGPSGALGGGAVILGGVVAAALSVRRLAPFLVLLVTNGAVAAWFVLGYPGRLVTVAALIGCYTVAAERGRRWAAAGWLVTGAVSTVVVHTTLGAAWFDDRAVNALALTLASAALGVAVHSHRAYAAGARERAERIAEARAEQARLDAAERRLSIARELHDVFGHTMAAVSVQAGVAAHVMERRPELAEQAVRTIKTITDEGLAEVQVLLGVLRAEDGAPAPGGLARLDTLLDVTRATGVPVRLGVRGDRRELPPKVDLAAFRIVQESLTNARRHAHPSSVQVELTYGEDVLEIAVRNDGVTTPTGTSGPAGGNGIAGMRARAAALGGTVTAAATGSDGFEVRAVLPVAGTPLPEGS
ncbi:MAG TPA: sensor histidine kinase [Pseudonocardia sp.]|nr:sensor histidine kinase [Pseudonocardia sp.]